MDTARRPAHGPSLIDEGDDDRTPPIGGHSATFRANAFEESLLFRGSVARMAQIHADTDVELVLFEEEGVRTRRLQAGETVWIRVCGVAVGPANNEVSGSFLVVAA